VTERQGPRLCTALRCKEYYVCGRLDLARCDDTTIFWCGRTQRAVGPDEVPALPERCGPERACFEGERESVQSLRWLDRPR
jgi:hypothetical protein